MGRSLVIGLGRSGLGAARLLKEEGHEVIVLEQSDDPGLMDISSCLQKEDIHVELGMPLEMNSFRPWLDQIDSVVISPGIAWDHPTLNALRERGVIVQGEISVAWKNLKHLPWIGITGTNGKSTVTHLLHHILEANQRKAPMAGNMGYSAAELALSLRHQSDLPSWVVVELSSYQIEAAPEIAPMIGIWTNLTPDHLERHGTLEKYRQIKSGLIRNSEIRIFNGDDPDLSCRRDNWGKGLWVSTNGPEYAGRTYDLWIDKEGKIVNRTGVLFDTSVFPMPGNHNLQNLLLSTAAALQLGLTPKDIEEGLLSFRGVPHRLEWIGKTKGMQVFNDSKATNYDSSGMGIKSVPDPVVIIAGGETKQGDPSDWLKQIHKKVCGVVLIGKGRAELKGLLEQSGYEGKIVSCEYMDEAVLSSIELGIASQARSLLLSPACASFDQYSDFEARGEHFRSLIVNQLDS